MPTLYVTAPPEAGREIARTVVEEALAACVNEVPCHSTYRWDDEIHEDDEVILLAKTTTETVDALVDRIDELHPYDVPCIERFDEDDVLDAYGEWIKAVVAGQSG